MKNTSFLRTVLGIAVPVALQSMLQASFAMIDQLMVGRLGSTAVAAVEVAGRPTFVFSVVAGAVASIAGIMISQYLGRNDEAMADRSLCVNGTACAAVAAVFTAVCLLLPRQVLGIYTADAALHEAGRVYLRIISLTYMPLGISSVLAVMIRCRGKASYPLYAGIVSAAVNTALNYVLIFGRLGLPALGVAGAAIASVCSQAVNLGILCALFARVNRGRGSRMQVSLALGAEGYRQLGAMLLPILANEFLWAVGQNVNTFIYAHIGTQELAAMSMTGPVQGLFIGALSGVSQAAGILIGKRLGAGQFDEAYAESKKLVWYGVAGSVALAVVLIALRRPYTMLYNVEETVRETAGWLLAAFAVLAPVKVSNMILGGGIVRSGGKTAYIMLIDMAGTWLVGVPLGLLTAFVWHLPVVAVYFILSQEELVRLALTLYVFRRRIWMRRIEA